MGDGKREMVEQWTVYGLRWTVDGGQFTVNSESKKRRCFLI
ncbi:hypothetical protein QNH98_08010 [Myroides sp. mNGS23_01]|nr:hypothetical protein [Myroides sp. mNGS23_01]WHT40490.1 hypothetical protein QNH98_08010 [Myroides sp. mNGS23_01]